MDTDAYNLARFSVFCHLVLRNIHGSQWAHRLGRLALIAVILHRIREGDALAIAAWLLVAVGAHCQEILHCRLLTAMIFLCLGADGCPGFRAMLCVLAVWSPLFPPKQKCLVDLGSTVQRGTKWRAEMKVARVTYHGSWVSREAALEDLAAMRAAESRESVPQIAVARRRFV